MMPFELRGDRWPLHTAGLINQRRRGHRQLRLSVSLFTKTSGGGPGLQGGENWPFVLPSEGAVLVFLIGRRFFPVAVRVFLDGPEPPPRFAAHPL